LWLNTPIIPYSLYPNPDPFLVPFRITYTYYSLLISHPLAPIEAVTPQHRWESRGFECGSVQA
ncbi:hypothetical protein, partial [Chryseobacterium arthrosphaerae]|uniref:hypothetical protein n=1 Tax=Chryseobacterium arthrosphaerae TaxID=651561 RepID=UPI0028A629C8